MKKNKAAAIYGAWGVILLLLFVSIQYLDKLSSQSDSVEAPKLNNRLIADRFDDILKHTVGTARGKKNAIYTIIEFGDFGYKPCSQVREALRIQLSDPNANINLYFINLPSDRHPYSLQAAQAVYYAADNGKFWDMYDLLFDNYESLEPGYYRDYAKKVGLNSDKLLKIIDNNSYRSQVINSVKYCDSIGVTVAPTIIVRNNTNGVVTSACGRKEIRKYLNNPPWNTFS